MILLSITLNTVWSTHQSVVAWGQALLNF